MEQEKRELSFKINCRAAILWEIQLSSILEARC